MYDVQLCTYVVHARYIPVTSDLRMRNRHVEVAYTVWLLTAVTGPVEKADIIQRLGRVTCTACCHIEQTVVSLIVDCMHRLVTTPLQTPSSDRGKGTA